MPNSNDSYYYVRQNNNAICTLLIIIDLKYNFIDWNDFVLFFFLFHSSFNIRIILIFSQHKQSIIIYLFIYLNEPKVISEQCEIRPNKHPQLPLLSSAIVERIYIICICRC